MEKAILIVKNFGPLKDINIEVRSMVTFIGAQASGKSTLAKLIAIFEDENFRKDENIRFENELKKYNLYTYLNINTKIYYNNYDYKFEYYNDTINILNPRELLKNRFIKTFESENRNINILLELINKDLELNSSSERTSEIIIKSLRSELVKLFNVDYNDSSRKEFLNDFFEVYENLLYKFNIYIKFDSLYIPSERNFIHLIAENTLGLINNNVRIPKHLLNTGQDYEKAIQIIKELPLKIIDKKIKYKREGKTSYIYHNDSEKVDLLESASGLQSIIPILLLVEYSNTLKDKYNFNFVVEEPELNLYPKAQHELIKYLVKNCLFDRKNLILTTHSPFVLASINNLLLAFDKGLSKPKEVAKIIKKESWLNPKNFIAYQLKNGKAYKIMDDKLGQIKENMIDNISDEFSDEFNKILDL